MNGRAASVALGLSLVLAAVGLVAAPSAQAGARADARALVRLIERGNRAIEEKTGDRAKGVDEGRAACPVNEDDAPPSVDPRIFAVVVSLGLRETLAPYAGDIEAFAARLEAYRTRDRTLRAAARGIARTQRLSRELARTAPDACAYFEGWQAAGWPLDYRMMPPARNLSADEDQQLQRAVRAIRQGESRLRRLGISKRRAQRTLEPYENLAFLSEFDL